MTENKQIGQRLAAKSPFAVVFTVIVFAALFVFSEVVWLNQVFASSAGVISVVFLLLYWHGKGGLYFILGLLSPMFAVVFSQLPDFLALAWVINGFFNGAALALMAYLYIGKAAQR
ncbi:hypothetical protein [Pseudoalteromonas piscicida]|uniref:Uncharacterized protein n=1 Tax=Pseudoalteromonas piscicida TaxID=43662 RepID=A0A2A5JSX7_PSEO7|nr:hypothetical protein [Pseudoalteromonas piscicida]PCK32572.1 hypothetical protein CEX98_06015 [Pseudoalteromonas piscicida]